MKILLVHPEDDPLRGAWVSHAWDRVIDLGRASPGSYERWSQFFACDAVPLEMLRREDFRTMRTIVASGFGAVVDREGLDWWELNSMIFHQQLETVIALGNFADQLGSQNELFVTRPGFHVDALRSLTGGAVRCFSNQLRERKRRFQRYLQIWSKFPLPQIVEILGDKYDPSFSIRRMFAPKKNSCRRPVVLLPSAYGNVSRTGIAYANTQPETQFLLVATRRSGRVRNPPANVAAADLASYASRGPESGVESGLLAGKWRRLRERLRSIREVELLARLGVLDSFPRLLRHGLEIRDAWRTVFEREPIRAVLCADDTNPYTHIPLLLARTRNIPAIACHHGALDGRHLFKRNHADVILAKGRMEEDYLVRVCGVPGDLVEVGGPVRATSDRAARADNGSSSSIVFFSEPYEIFGARAAEFYRDIVPPLAGLAAQTGKRLIIKLHPAESLRERERMVSKILPHEERAFQIVSGPLNDELLANTWFGVTVCSTVAIECSLFGVPCFVCQWLDYWHYGYIEQFARFGVGRVLKSAAQIGEIPRLVESVGTQETRDLWRRIDRERLQNLFNGERAIAHALAI